MKILHSLRSAANHFLENELACACAVFALAIIAISIDLLNAGERLS